MDDLTDSTSSTSRTLETIEPPRALVIGGIFGATTFLLCGLLFGARAVVLIAVIAALVALARRTVTAVVGFALAGALAAAASTTALTVASAAFGIALAVFARARMRASLAVERTSSEHVSTASVQPIV